MKFQIFAKSKQNMEPKTKKVKLSEENVSLDPLERIHSDLHNLVFQHFKGTDVMELSKVATSWYLNLGSSQVAMSKVQLSLVVQPKKYEDALLTSQRRYSSFALLCDNRPTAMLHFNILKTFADSLEHLEVKQIVQNFHKMGSDINSFQFPKLKSLKMTKNSGPRSSQLKFAQWILNKTNKRAFRKIHLAQYSSELLKMALEMPNLKFFGVSYVSKCPVKNLELPVNASVAAAAVDGFNRNLKSFSDLLPNLEEIEIGYINSDRLKIIAENATKLKRIYFEESWDHTKKRYEKMKLANPLINQNIELIRKPKGFNLMEQN
jgi:hypothetical protein